MRLVLVSLAAAAVVFAAAPSSARAQRPTAPPAAPPPAPSSGAAPSSGPLKIAIINSQEILHGTPGYAAAESTYRKLVEGYQTEVQRLRTQLDSAVQAFDQQSIALSPAARATKQRDLQAMQQRMDQRTSELQDQANQKQQELMAPIQSRIQSVVQGIRAEMNYSVILDADAGTVVAWDPALNITARVLQRLTQAQ